MIKYYWQPRYIFFIISLPSAFKETLLNWYIYFNVSISIHKFASKGYKI